MAGSRPAMSIWGGYFQGPIDVGHRTLRATFEHMIFNVEFWTAVMVGQPVDAQREDRSLAALTERRERSYAAFAHLKLPPCEGWGRLHGSPFEAVREFFWFARGHCRFGLPLID
jgi:hypothetical protein